MTRLAIATLNGYRDLENAFRFLVITLKKFDKISDVLPWRYLLYAGVLRVRITVLLLLAAISLLLNVFT